jgi:hypothetical protein
LHGPLGSHIEEPKQGNTQGNQIPSKDHTKELNPRLEAAQRKSTILAANAQMSTIPTMRPFPMRELSSKEGATQESSSKKKEGVRHTKESNLKQRAMQSSKKSDQEATKKKQVEQGITLRSRIPSRSGITHRAQARRYTEESNL